MRLRLLQRELLRLLQALVLVLVLVLVLLQEQVLLLRRAPEQSILEAPPRLRLPERRTESEITNQINHVLRCCVVRTLFRLQKELIRIISLSFRDKTDFVNLQIISSGRMTPTFLYALPNNRALENATRSSRRSHPRAPRSVCVSGIT